MNPKAPLIYEFAQFRLDPVRRALLSARREPIPLTPKNLETLLVLVENRDRVLGKEELIERLWPDSVVEENNLTQNISALRKALGERPNEQRFIKTIPGRGYRFVAEVREVKEERFQAADELTAPKPEAARPPEQRKETAETQAAPTTALADAQSRSGAWWWKLALATLLVAVPLLALGYWRGREPQDPPSTPPAVQSLAVLPFKSLNPQSPEGEQYLSIGLADVMITQLSNLSQLVVRPTSSVLPFSNQDALQAGQTLKVDLVLDGSIQKINDKVRVTVRLLRTRDGKPLWAYQCDQQCTDIFTLQDKVSALITEGLALRLSGEEKQRLTRRYTDNAAAYQEYLIGRFYTLQYTPEGNQKAIEHLNEALRLDSTYALAYAGLADAYAASSDTLLPPREALFKAGAAAEKALVLDDTLAEAHAALGHVLVHQFDPAAEAQFQRAMALNPNSVAAMFFYFEYFYTRGETDKSVSILRRVQQLDPLSPTAGAFIASSYLMARRNDEAEREARKALELDSNDPLSRVLLAMAYSAKGAHAEAIAELEKVKSTVPTSMLAGLLGLEYAWSYRRDDAQRMLAELNQMARRQYVSPFDVALVYVGLGDKDQAFVWLEKAREDQSEWIGTIKWDARLDSLRADPRFEDLLKRASAAR